MSATNLPTVPALNDRWVWNIWRTENWQGKLKYFEKTCPSATLSPTKPTWPGLELSPQATVVGIRAELRHSLPSSSSIHTAAAATLFILSFLCLLSLSLLVALCSRLQRITQHCNSQNYIFTLIPVQLIHMFVDFSIILKTQETLTSNPTFQKCTRSQQMVTNTVMV
jgi:hypothetical protein